MRCRLKLHPLSPPLSAAPATGLSTSAPDVQVLQLFLLHYFREEEREVKYDAAYANKYTSTPGSQAYSYKRRTWFSPGCRRNSVTPQFRDSHMRHLPCNSSFSGVKTTYEDIEMSRDSSCHISTWVRRIYCGRSCFSVRELMF